MRALNRLFILTATLLLPAGTALSATPPMPRVVHELTAPVETTFISKLSIVGRTVAYVLQKTECVTPDDCTPTWVVTQYDGVRSRAVFTSPHFIYASKLSDELLVWQEFGDGFEFPLWKATRTGAPTLLSGSSRGDAFDIAGKHVVWGDRDPSSSSYDILLDGKNLTKQPAPEPHPLGLSPAISGSTVVFPAVDENIVLKRGGGKYVNLPLLLEDQTYTDVEVGQKGDKVILLKRDFVDEATHHELSIYDVSSKNALTIPLPNAPLQGIPYDGGRDYAWLMGTADGPHLQLTDVETGVTEDIESSLDAGSFGATAGTVSAGFLSYVVVFDGPRLYDIANGENETIGLSGGENGIANSKRNVAWVDYDATNATVRVSYPADEALMAIADALKTKELHPSQRSLLRRSIKLALHELKRGDLSSTRTNVEVFDGAVVELQNAGLDDQLASALRVAAQRIIAALPSS